MLVDAEGGEDGCLPGDAADRCGCVVFFLEVLWVEVIVEEGVCYFWGWEVLHSRVIFGKEGEHIVWEVVVFKRGSEK